MKDTYKTITTPSTETLYKEKNSKFFGYAFPINNEDEVKPILESIKKQHHSARHWCYAWQLGTDQNISFRANDDGEPNNSAGMPIYGQIQSFELTNILIIVVRYFGGVKLGVGGLITAYKTAAQYALEGADIVEKTIDSEFALYFEYKNMNKVMRIVKEKNLNIIDQKMELDCFIKISVRKKEAGKTKQIFDKLYGVTLKEL
ncbi:IMPACT family protein [Zhouia amylolytica]|uniref:IMPACT family protein n=1 Tax=Zhouia amylolytica TaxID=376730 RepID=UPI0020CE385D|nr:YigZ family protein [Zhouia amylolytica]MCQ0110848.1 YigZ family protein [Zhouia amylolytica]